MYGLYTVAVTKISGKKDGGGRNEDVTYFVLQIKTVRTRKINQKEDRRSWQTRRLAAKRFGCYGCGMEC